MVRFFIFILFFGLCFAQYQIWAGKASWDHIEEMRESLRQQQALNEELRRSNDAIEEHARNDLNMIRPNEVLFRIETTEEAQKKTNAIESMPNVNAPDIKAGSKPTFEPKKSDLYHAPKNLRAPRARDRRD